jgi:peptidoglycan L-alanyl-D-glutamate endopeptidase CwlK
MPKFSKTSKENLYSCDRDLQILFEKVVESFDCTILEGHRSIEKQQKLYNKGKSQIDGINKKSMHNYKPSRAVDVISYPINWDDINTHYYFAGYVKGIAQQLYEQGKMRYKIRNGADWNMNNNIHDQSFNDLVHFELYGYKL